MHHGSGLLKAPLPLGTQVCAVLSVAGGAAASEWVACHGCAGWGAPSHEGRGGRHQEKALKDVGVPFIVAPYEADAQMCYLSLIGEAHAVITEDSDLLAYGCERVSQCGEQTVLYKLDRNGHGEEICLADLPRNKGLSFVGFSHNMFLEVRACWKVLRIAASCVWTGLAVVVDCKVRGCTGRYEWAI
eukprot:1139079-Pelagomonas_calceolata.AAC.2